MKINLNGVNHIAIICSNYEISKEFYTTILGFEILNETYRAERQSYKLDLALRGRYLIELFSFPTPPARLTHPEASGLRHLAFEVDHLDETLSALAQHNITAEPVRTDELTQKRFTFIFDPDHLPIELVER
jgi:Lactoylglutathione lyase and related lyases